MNACQESRYCCLPCQALTASEGGPIVITSWDMNALVKMSLNCQRYNGVFAGSDIHLYTQQQLVKRGSPQMYSAGRHWLVCCS